MIFFPPASSGSSFTKSQWSISDIFCRNRCRRESYDQNNGRNDYFVLFYCYFQDDLIQELKVKADLLSPAAIEAAASIPRKCAVGNCSSSGDLLRCSKCKRQWYCGADHQRQDWPLHKLKCREPTASEEVNYLSLLLYSSVF